MLLQYAFGYFFVVKDSVGGFSSLGLPFVSINPFHKPFVNTKRRQFFVSRERITVHLNSKRNFVSSNDNSDNVRNDSNQIISNYIQILVDQGELSPDEIDSSTIKYLSELCISMTNPSSSNVSDTKSFSNQSSNFELIQLAIQNYLRQKKSRLQKQENPISKPGPYILAILRNSSYNNSQPKSLNVVNDQPSSLNSTATSPILSSGFQQTKNIIVDKELAIKCLEYLYLLEKPISNLDGVGPKSAIAFKKMKLNTIRSLIFYFPTSFMDRSILTNDLSQTSTGQIVTTTLSINSCQRGRQVFIVYGNDSVGNQVQITFFHGPSSRGQNLATSLERRLFGHRANFIESNTNDNRRIISGKVRRNYSSNNNDNHRCSIEIINPDIVMETLIEPVYRRSQDISKNKMSSTIRKALDIGMNLLDEIPDILPMQLRQQLKWPSLKDSLLLAHFPKSSSDAIVGPRSPARMCIAFHELCIQQAQLGLTRWRYKNPLHRFYRQRDSTNSRYVLPATHSSWKECPLTSIGIASLPFDLTECQKRCLTEAWDDALRFPTTELKGPSKMARLLQGEVSSGKTVVAYLLGLGCLESSHLNNIVVILAPTTLLANQHRRTIVDFVQRLKVKSKFYHENSHVIKHIHVEMISGNVIGSNREDILQRIENCKCDEGYFLIGTHALLTTDVATRLSRLNPLHRIPGISLTIIDEEQRFGVQQRELITRCSIHSLFMTATPIPRTMALVGTNTIASTTCLTGSLDVSILETKPNSSRHIKTSIVESSKIDELIEGVKRQIEKNAKVFWILPFIGTEDNLILLDEVDDESNDDVSCVLTRYSALVLKIGGDRIGMIHGRMSTHDRERQLRLFADPTSKVDVLVGTSVLEVGIDIPNANILIIEDAHKFGLSQIHQLRGRIGRTQNKLMESSAANAANCHCVLLTNVYSSIENNKVAVKRLDIIRNCVDGFKIAQADLLLRGPGEILGLHQSGKRNGYSVDLLSHLGLLSAASRIGRSFLLKEAGPHTTLDLISKQTEIDNNAIADIGGYSECEIIESFNQVSNSSITLSSHLSSPSGFTMYALLAFYGQWHYNSIELSTSKAFETLITMTKNDNDIEEEIQNLFTKFAREMSAGINSSFHDFIITDEGSKKKLHTEQIMTDQKQTNPRNIIKDERIYLLLDVETTGLTPQTSHVIQIAAKVMGSSFNNYSPNSFSEYVLPPIQISSEIEDLTGITNAFLNNGGIEKCTGDLHLGPANNFERVYYNFCKFCHEISAINENRGITLLAHNAPFDIRMLTAETKRLAEKARKSGATGRQVPSLARDCNIVSYVDTLQLFKIKSLWKPSKILSSSSYSSELSVPRSYALESIYKYVLKKSFPNAHNAVFDVQALEEILLSPQLTGWKDFAIKIEKRLVFE